eukprot:5833538-Amphidinium_carterae.1
MMTKIACVCNCDDSSLCGFKLSKSPSEDCMTPDVFWKPINTSLRDEHQAGILFRWHRAHLDDFRLGINCLQQHFLQFLQRPDDKQ